PPATSAITTASLPGGKPLPGGRELGIPGTPARLVNQTWDRKGQESEGNGSGLQPVAGLGVPMDHEGTALTSGQTVSNGIETDVGNPGGTETYDQVLQDLKKRGVDWCGSPEKLANGVRIMCTLPDRQNPNKFRTYEATAATELAAIKAVREKVIGDR